MGVLTMRFDDFCRLSPSEFRECCKSYHTQAENKLRDDWERMRMLATILLQPHVKGKLTPKKLLSLPWESKKQTPKRQDISREDARKRFEKITKGLLSKRTT